MYDLENMRPGDFLVRPSEERKEDYDTGFLATRAYQVCYTHDGDQKYTLSNAFSDGLVFGVGSIWFSKSLEELKEKAKEKGLRFASYDELDRLISLKKKRHEV